MKRKFSAIIIVMSMMLVLAGCGNALPDMSVEEMDAIGEYAAITLMKYDANHRSRLVDLSKYEEPEKRPDPVPQEPSQEEELTGPETEDYKPAEPEPVVPAEPEFDSVADFMGLPEGVELNYVDYKVRDSYPEGDDLFYLEASSDRKLIVVNFTLNNQSGTAQSLDFLNSGNQYRLQIGTAYRKNALTTILLDDMSTYKATLQSGATENLVLLFEVDSQYENPEQEMKLNLKNESNSYTILLD